MSLEHKFEFIKLFFDDIFQEIIMNVMKLTINQKDLE